MGKLNSFVVIFVARSAERVGFVRHFDAGDGTFAIAAFFAAGTVERLTILYFSCG